MARRHATGRLDGIADQALRADRQTDKNIGWRPVAGGHASARLRIASVTVRALALIIAVAQAILAEIGTARTVGFAATGFERIFEARRAFYRAMDVSHAGTDVAQVAVVTVRA
jgi:hypothetical protein